MTPLETAAIQAIHLMDLTSLNEDDDILRIRSLCESANTMAGQVAAVCVYPRFITTARQILNELGLSQVKVATVTNFPHGNTDIDKARLETRHAVIAGADEVDVVFPYHALIDGDKVIGRQLVLACKEECGPKVKLKVIIESGVLHTPELIQHACEAAITGGADFIKTSTGKVKVNATLSAAEVMLSCIKNSGRSDLGFKAAGGVSSTEDARDYLELANKIMGPDWLSSDRFRFGASSLLGKLLTTLGENQTQQSAPGATY